MDERWAPIVLAHSMVSALGSASELSKSFEVIVREGADALHVSQDAMLQASYNQIAELALQHRLPAIFPSTVSTVAEHGLMVFHGFSQTGRRAAEQADKILKGAKPGDLPIELPTRFNLVVNLKIAECSA